MVVFFLSNGKYIDCLSLTYATRVTIRVVIVISRQYSQFSIIFVLASQYCSHSVMIVWIIIFYNTAHLRQGMNQR
jgi:hypothetical protein